MINTNSTFHPGHLQFEKEKKWVKKQCTRPHEFIYQTPLNKVLNKHKLVILIFGP
jgi:hypothetical protein